MYALLKSHSCYFQSGKHLAYQLIFPSFIVPYFHDIRYKIKTTVYLHYLFKRLQKLFFQQRYLTFKKRRSQKTLSESIQYNLRSMTLDITCTANGFLLFFSFLCVSVYFLSFRIIFLLSELNSSANIDSFQMLIVRLLSSLHAML